VIARGPLDYDFDEKHVDAGGIDIAYVDEGPRDGGGTPMVLVHGIGATLDHWGLVLPVLAATRRVIALDLPGFGRSEKPDRHYNPQSFVEALRAFLDALGLDRIVLVGHSMGGAITAEFTLTYPGRIERLVLVDAAGMTRMPTRLLDFLVIQFEKSVDAKKVHLPPRLVRAMAKVMFYEPVPFAERNIGRILASMSEGDWPDRVRSFVRAATGLSRSQVRTRLMEFETPTLIVWGERDRVLPIRHGRALAAGIRGSRIVVFPDTGHCPQIERPARFCDELEKFLAPLPDSLPSIPSSSRDEEGAA
jgi:pimeloyl-ACP methyl ester carboxylesterase